MRRPGVRLGQAVHTSTQRYVEANPPIGGAGKGQRNGVPQKKQNRLSAFTIVPQFGQRFFIAVAVGMGVEGICWVGAGRTNSIGGGRAFPAGVGGWAGSGGGGGGAVVALLLLGGQVHGAGTTAAGRPEDRHGTGEGRLGGTARGVRVRGEDGLSGWLIGVPRVRDAQAVFRVVGGPAARLDRGAVQDVPQLDVRQGRIR